MQNQRISSQACEACGEAIISDVEILSASEMLLGGKRDTPGVVNFFGRYDKFGLGPGVFLTKENSTASKN